MRKLWLTCVAVLVSTSILLGAIESVQVDSGTKQIRNPVIKFGTGNTLDVTGATVTGFTGGAITSVFGRTGVVVSTDGDYIASQVTNSVDITSSYSDPSWITSLVWSKITGAPTTLSGYGITDAQPLDADLTAIAALVTDTFGRVLLTKSDAASVRTYIGAGTSSFDGTFSSLTGTPTTLSGYGITDAQSLDTQLTSLAGLSYAGNTLKVIRVNAGETGFELAVAGGGGGSPGGSDTQLQYNNAGSFGGIAGATTDGISVTLASPSITTPTGIVKGDIGLGSVTNDAQTRVAIVPNTAPSSGQVLIGNAGGTAYAKQTLSGSGATATISDAGVLTLSAIPNATLNNSAVTIAGTSTSLGGSITLDAISGVSTNGFLKRTGVNTWTNDTGTTVVADTGAASNFLTAISATGVISKAQPTSTDVGLGSVTNDAQTKAAVVPNTAPSSGQVLIGNAGGTAYAKQTVSGSGATATMSSAGVLTLSAIPNATLSNSAVTIAGTSTSLGGSISLDTISGVSANGFLKRTSANTWTNDSSTYITGNQSITLSGDVTGSGSTGITTVNVNLPDGVTQAGSLVLTDIAAPTSPAAAHLKVFGDSTDLRFHDKNAAGTIGTTVVADTGASNNFLTAVSAAGVISKAQPTQANISGLTTADSPQFTALNVGAATDTTITRSGAGAVQVEGVQVLLSGAALGTPASGTLTNCTFPTLNQNTTGSAASLSVSGQTGLVTVTGLASTNRIKTVRDAADTILELGGSYTPTGTWTSLTMVTPVLGTPTSGTLTNCTALPVSGITASTSTALGVGSIELGHATDTTIARVSAGVASIEGNSIVTTNTNVGGWTALKVAGSDFTTTSTSLVDVTGLVSGTLSAATMYEVEAILYVNSTSSAGLAVGVQQSGGGSGQIGVWSGEATSAAATGIAISSNALNTAGAPCVLVNGDGAVTFRGMIKTGSTGSPTISCKILKTTSGTAKVYISSVFRYRPA